MSRPFLTARWQNLLLATYPVPAALLEARLPARVRLETRDGMGLVSLVAFEFLDTRVCGMAIPGYRNFAELNLRYYVHYAGQRGVVFIREFVPQRAVAWLARLLYNEPYRAAPLRATCRDEEPHRTMEYVLRWAGREHRIRVQAARPSYVPDESSEEHHFKEHHWGFGKDRKGQTLRYEVQHPVWEVLPVRDYSIELDWAAVYGPEWGFLSKATPCSTIFALGSEIAVFPKGSLPGVG